MERCYCGNDNLTEYSPKYYKCDMCGSLVSKYDFTQAVSQVTSEEEDLYGKNYWETVMIKEAGVRDMDELIDLYLSERCAYWLKVSLQYLKLGGKVADVGCGLGQFSFMLKAAGFQPVSFELSPQICQYIEKRLWLKTICGELSSSNEEYDAIFAADVFEHLLEPERFLDDCAQRLEAGGVLILQMPCYNPEYTYNEMLEKSPRFKHLLVEDQHIFLYSRHSIERLLKKHDFDFVAFEPAFFGDDYDMFLFASKESICKNTQEEINRYLNGIPAGRIIKALLKLYDEKVQEADKVTAIDNERNKMMRDVELLTQTVKEKEGQVELFSRAAEERLEDVEELAKNNGRLQQEADKRLSDVERLSEENKVLRQEAAKRLTDVKRLAEANKILQQEADKRLEDVEKLTETNGVLRREADKCLADMESLKEENKILTEEINNRFAIFKHLKNKK